MSYISPNTAKSLKIHNAVAPKIYGLPKTHKEGMPLRPIVSCIQSPFENLSKYLKNIISNVINKNPHYLKDADDLKSKLKNIHLPQEYKLVSLDVVSLYTNVPIAFAKDIIKEKWNEIKIFTDIPLEEFILAVETTLKSTYFIYKNKIFQQTDGCAMGASISSAIAQLVLEHLEEIVLNKIDFDILFFYRYIDDCLTAAPEDKLDILLSEFNNFHQKLNFTLEIEKNCQINFLDLTLHRNNSTITTSWYTKKTWSSRYLNFNSHHPLSQKKSVVIGLADRAIKLSDPINRPQAIEKAKTALALNSYPHQLIETTFKSRLHTFYNNRNNNKNIKVKKNYMSLPYIKGLSEQLANLLSKHNITVAHKGYNLVKRNYIQIKAKTPQLKKSHVVYEIPCSNCDGVYIGQTSQLLNSRIRSHKYDKKNSTALTKHENEKRHKFDFDKTKILKTEQNRKKRELLESIEIKKNNNAINDKKDVNQLNKIYFNLI
ncbi:uncharacterized protein LOC126888113 [Diabrotica virgifera virgifera]|uniref:Reverse transcriptase domain-containing protein n=1 Tax=Diabrotica virgifera virgifera TaxID=50390 RepID=A0ABM5KPH7_DIAVI|nr:uncharacterized protein LOC126888113 [Diabrotica virgifera virgifera]